MPPGSHSKRQQPITEPDSSDSLGDIYSDENEDIEDADSEDELPTRSSKDSSAERKSELSRPSRRRNLITESDVEQDPPPKRSRAAAAAPKSTASRGTTTRRSTRSRGSPARSTKGSGSVAADATPSRRHSRRIADEGDDQEERNENNVVVRLPSRSASSLGSPARSPRHSASARDANSVPAISPSSPSLHPANGSENSLPIPDDDAATPAPVADALLRDAAALVPVPTSNLQSHPPVPPSSAALLAEAAHATLHASGLSRKHAPADVEPVSARGGSDTDMDWSQVGGLAAHVQTLHEMVVMPLLYPELFDSFGLAPPRGVLFTGPPGTGKTLTARALAATCSQMCGKEVSFFVRKGADCLSKWVGEAERQLRLLFEEARARQPAVIFFDEIDGLAPVRSAQQDQVHSSIVSTLLALMDGLDARGQVIVIGATNRVDAIDPALRRPGRFDRELLFSLPSQTARAEILRIHTRKWVPQPPAPLIEDLARRTAGFCGADLRALCTEASLAAIRRCLPAVYRASAPLAANAAATVSVMPADFNTAFLKVTPASQRATASAAAPLPVHLRPVLQPLLDVAMEAVRNVWPASLTSQSTRNAANAADGSAPLPYLVRPRVLLYGPAGSGQAQVAAAVLDQLEEFPCYSLQLSLLLSDATCHSPEQAIVQTLTEARRNAPSVVLLPEVEHWLRGASAQMQSVLLAELESLAAGVPVLLLGTSCSSSPDDETLERLFDSEGHMCERVDLYEQLQGDAVGAWLEGEVQSAMARAVARADMATLTAAAVQRATAAAKTADDASTSDSDDDSSDHDSDDSDASPSSAVVVPPRPQPVAAARATTALVATDAERVALQEQQRHDEVLLLHLRIFLRSVTAHLAAHYRDFVAPGSGGDRPIPHAIYLRDVQLKVADAAYLSVREFLVDIDTLVAAVRAHFTLETAHGRTMVQRVGQLQDTALVLCMGLDRTVALACEVVAHRLRTQPGGYVPWPSLMFVPDPAALHLRPTHPSACADGAPARDKAPADKPVDATRTAKNKNPFKAVAPAATARPQEKAMVLSADASAADTGAVKRKKSSSKPPAAEINLESATPVLNGPPLSSSVSTACTVLVEKLNVDRLEAAWARLQLVDAPTSKSLRRAVIKALNAD